MLHHLSIIVADLGRFAHLRGTIARTPSRCLIIEDHRLSMPERVQFVTDHIDLSTVTNIDVTVLTDVTPDCDAGLHEWRVSDLTSDYVAVVCARCDIVERAPRLPYWTGAVLRAPRLPYNDKRETIDHGMD